LSDLRQEIAIAHFLARRMNLVARRDDGFRASFTELTIDLYRFRQARKTCPKPLPFSRRPANRKQVNAADPRHAYCVLAT